MAVLDDDVFFNPGDFSRRVTVADLKETIGEGSGGEVTWADVTGKPSTYAPTIGTTATTAKAGNYTPPNATASVKGLVSMGAAVADATEETQLAQLNALLASLRAAGIIAA